MTLEGAKKALKGNKEGVAKNSELLERLKSIKAELLVIKKQLGHLT